MPVLYHGTSFGYATAMAGTPAVGTIDITRGEGEFGQGFYTQKSSSNAARRGQGIYGQNYGILVLTIDDQAYHGLRFKRLTLRMVQRLDARLKNNHTKNIYTTAHDVMSARWLGSRKSSSRSFKR